jgi:muramoyltetrapeptide carboxypeptidase
MSLINQPQTKNLVIAKTIYCFSPSGRLINPSDTQKGVVFLEQQGFKVLNTKIFSRQFQRFAGSAQERADEINSLDDKVDQYGPMIALATRGGFGLNQIMHLIDWQKLGIAVQKGLKIVGHSDITALQLGLLSKAGAKSYAGPMLNFDFARSEMHSSDFTYAQFVDTVINQLFDIEISGPQQFVDQPRQIKNAMIWGGNLSLVQNLLGTPYFPKNIEQGILFLEDVNEHPYRIERMLWQLLDAGVLGSQQAILFGEFSEYRLTELDQDYDFNVALGNIQRELNNRGYKTLLVKGLPFGHIPKKVTIEVGGYVDLELNSEGFHLYKAS